ncbi:uncharacterized protein LOC116027050 [Ipomoea triloba]|uniref:uncharacterized protein LOC116027050 n=1 Tax=Ipomoea triloba TaxID=35885 RepID=UPI00125D9D60|nr:uncharacterized protein LOC116027050 [Ipomoea triloba]
MPMKYDHVVVSITESHDTEDLTITELKEVEDLVEVVEEEEDDSEEEDVVIQIKEGDDVISIKEEVEYGHKIAYCWYKEDNHENQANVAEKSSESSTESETLFLASNSLSADENIWFLDTGCKSKRATKQLEIVHSDLCSLEVPSNGGCKYFVTFIDDFSRKTWVYFLKQESDACDVFQQFKHQMTTRYTPQENGVAERKNRCPTKSVRDKTPDEAWSGNKPSIRHLKLVPNNVQSSLQPESSVRRSQPERHLAARLQDYVLGNDNDLTDEEIVHKHIDIKYHKIRELVAAKQINIEYCASECHVADIFTKPLKTEAFLQLKKEIGMTNLSNLV